MSKGGATAIVFVTGGLLVTLALLQKGSLSSGDTYKRIWGAGLLTAGLSILVDFVPELVGPFAILIVIAAVAKSPGALEGFIGGGQKTANPAVNPALAGPVKP